MIEETLVGIQVPVSATVQDGGGGTGVLYATTPIIPETSNTINSNGTSATDLYAKVNALLSQANTVKSNPLVSGADLVAIKAKLTAWASSIKGNNMIVSSGDASLITDGVKAAQDSITKYSNDVADANKNVLIFGGILVVAVVLIVVIKK